MMSGRNLSGSSQYLCISITAETNSILESPGSAMVAFLRLLCLSDSKTTLNLGESLVYKSCGKLAHGLRNHPCEGSQTGQSFQSFPQPRPAISLC
jgi:hypothetical protein